MSYFSLFPSCTITRGFSKSCLIDLERSAYCSIPNELHSVLEKKHNIGFKEIENNYLAEDFEIIKRYLNVLEEEKFIFFHAKSQENLRDISKERFSVPYVLEDLVLDIRSFEQFDQMIKKVSLHIETVQLRVFYKASIQDLYIFVKEILANGFTNVEMVLNYNRAINEKEYIELYNSYEIISKIFLLNFGNNAHIVPNKIIGLRQALISTKQCGQISEKQFYPNLRTYLTSKHCNTCLNRKIAIDTEGNIKNCPSMPESYGNIKDTTLQQALQHKDFKKHWSITKDQINVCKDCEFRYVCTDCRAYLEDPDYIYSKPLKCGYGPYTNTWEEWSNHPLKQKAIDHYGLREVLID